MVLLAVVGAVEEEEEVELPTGLPVECERGRLVVGG